MGCDEMSVSDSMKIHIEGERIYLREVRLSDVNDDYCRWLNDPEVNRYLETRFMEQNLESVREYVEGKINNRDEELLAICLKEDNRHIGNIKLGPINRLHRFADISLFIGDKSCRGEGLGTEAIRLITRFAFADLNLNKVKAGCYEANKASAGSFIKAGFYREGILKKQRYSDGVFQDEILFGLCREDYGELRISDCGFRDGEKAKAKA
ncbi:MAG: GNAT family protein [Pseudomonadota bacterium]